MFLGIPVNRRAITHTPLRQLADAGYPFYP